MKKNNTRTVDILIELNKNKLNELKRQINDLEEQRLSFVKNLKQLEFDAEQEVKKYIGSEYVFMLDNYLKNIELNKKKLTGQIKYLESSIVRLHVAVSNYFAELKKFEIIRQNHFKKQNEQIKKDETKFFDEINVINGNSKLR